jgi:hypothetical protein
MFAGLTGLADSRSRRHSSLDPQLGPDGLASGSCSGQSRAEPERSIRALRDAGRHEAVSPIPERQTTPALNLRQVNTSGARSGSPNHGFRRQAPNGLHSRGTPRGRPGFGPAPLRSRRAPAGSATRPMAGDQARWARDGSAWKAPSDPRRTAKGRHPTGRSPVGRSGGSRWPSSAARASNLERLHVR